MLRRVMRARPSSALGGGAQQRPCRRRHGGAQRFEACPLLVGIADVAHSSDQRSLGDAQPPPQVERASLLGPLAERRVADAAERAPRDLLRKDAAHPEPACVPDRPAEAELDSLIAGVDREDEGTARDAVREPWMDRLLTE